MQPGLEIKAYILRLKSVKCIPALFWEHLVLIKCSNKLVFCVNLTICGNAFRADPGFEKGGFNIVPKSDTGGATHNYL